MNSEDRIRIIIGNYGGDFDLAALGEAVSQLVIHLAKEIDGVREEMREHVAKIDLFLGTEDEA